MVPATQTLDPPPHAAVMEAARAELDLLRQDIAAGRTMLAALRSGAEITACLSIAPPHGNPARLVSLGASAGSHARLTALVAAELAEAESLAPALAAVFGEG
jgi:hypothetical protein